MSENMQKEELKKEENQAVEQAEEEASAQKAGKVFDKYIFHLKKPVSFEEGNPEKDAQLFFTLASCNPDQHLANMMKLSEMLMNEEVVEALAAAKTPEDLMKIQETYLD